MDPRQLLSKTALATNDLGEGIDASPAVAGNELFLRGREHLFKIAN